MSSSSRPKDTKSELKMKMQSGGKKTAKNKGEKRTRKRKNETDLDYSSDEGGFVCLGENYNARNIVPDSSSSSSDDGIVVVDERNEKNRAFSKNVRGFRANVGSRNDNVEPHVGGFYGNVSEDSDEDGFEVVKMQTFSENEVSGDENSERSLGATRVTRVGDFVEGVGGDSDKSTEKSFDPNVYELESSCEEDDMDESDEENDVVVGRTIMRYKGFLGMEVKVNFEGSSGEGTRSSKSTKKVPRKADKSNSLQVECSSKKKRSRKEEVGKGRTSKNAELVRRLLNAVNEDRNGLVHEPLPSKFAFEDEVLEPTPEQTEWDKEVESLFLELNYCLRMIEIESANVCKIENEDTTIKVVGESPAASCTHDLVLDEQIGSVCRFCGVILLESKYILPPWYTPRSEQQERKYFGEMQNPVNNESQSHISVIGPSESMRVQGTVWDMIPGFEKHLFPHQREGFEFLWKNIAGDIAIEKLPESLSDEGRGCIISHVPGTGKTRLAVVFLLSFLKRYPKACPVILAPPFVLSTWEKELIKWKVDVPFHDMTNQKLSRNETRYHSGTVGQGICLAKLLSWIEGGGILGISYTLFVTLASNSEKGGDDGEAIWKALVRMPGLLVLDEGHTTRNGKWNECIRNSLKKVMTKRCIVLSGTPFQNNLKKLKILLGLVDPRFSNMDKSSWKKLTEGRDEPVELHSRLDPYVHYHKGRVLQKSLPGLKDTLIFLRPSELQKALMDACKSEKVHLTLTHLVSLISVHPSALTIAEKTNSVKKKHFSLFQNKIEEIESDLDEGVKIKFVMSLIQLADELGERVLVFSYFRYPLIFIKKQLENKFSWKEGREVLHLDRKLDEKNSKETISLFNDSSSGAKVLLAAEHACSEGISLVGASRVILLTSVWNPRLDRQAISRAYRLDQKKVVYVYRLITSGMEVRQYESMGRKDQISQLILSAVDEQAGDSESSCEILEDKILEQMQNLESFREVFDKIVHQPKESDYLENFRFRDL